MLGKSESFYENYIRLIVTSETQKRSVAGTVFSDGKPRIIQIKGINLEAELGDHMLYVSNEDKPGFIGALGAVLGQPVKCWRMFATKPVYLK